MLRIMKSDEGVLTFEWILLVTLLVIGVIAGLSALRDAMTVELADVAQAAGNVNQSFSYAKLETKIEHDSTGFIDLAVGGSGSEMIDMSTIVSVDSTTGELEDTNGL